MWADSVEAINKYLADEIIRESPSLPGSPPQPELWYGHADMNTGKRTATTYGALDAFFPSALALSGDIDRAQRLQKSSFNMWDVRGIEPEEINYTTMEATSPGYPLRPEIVESTYYLHHYAVREQARQMRRGRRESRRIPSYLAATIADAYLTSGQKVFRDFVKYCRTDEGYAALKSVVTKEKSDSMQSFLFAETFKYFYLLFASPKTLSFDRVIFNTEAHPIRKNISTLVSDEDE